MFLQKFDILINKQASPITNFNDEVTKLPASDEITRIDGTPLTSKKSMSTGTSASSYINGSLFHEDTPTNDKNKFGTGAYSKLKDQ
jgi:hypothetical protein